jgi:catechol 2,3-dioxygenase-like lactoylglutathione lyase family enzyme
MTRPTISGISPFFVVADVPATLSFYRDMLGFEVTFRGHPEALAAEFASRGVRFSVPLGDDDDDGLRGFVVEDLDGYGLFFGHVRA